MRLYLHRDLQVGAQVTRRYYEYRILLDPPCPAPCPRKTVMQLGETHPAVRAWASEVYDEALSRKQASYTVLRQVAEALELTRGRKSILFLSEGFIQEPERPEHRTMVRAAQRANAAVHFLDAGGLTGIPATADAEIADHTDLRDMGPQLNEATVESLGAVSLAAETGGRVIKNMNDPAVGLRRLERESRAYYLIGFEPRGIEADGTFHRLDVEVRRPGVEVLAHRGYYAPTDEPESTTAETAPDPRLRRALDSPFEADAIPLRMTSYVLGPADEGTSVLLVADVDPQALLLEEKDDPFEGALGIHIVVSHRDTGARVVRDRKVDLSLTSQPLGADSTHATASDDQRPLVTGRHQVRLLVRDLGSDAIGTVRHELDVPLPGAFRLTTPILTDLVLPAGGEDASVGRPIPLARRTFTRGQTLTLLYQVYGASAGTGTDPPVVAGYRVEAADGTVVASQPETPLPRGPAGQISQMAAISLAGESAGESAGVVHARHEESGRTLSSRTPFRVAPTLTAMAADGPPSAPPVTDPEVAALLERVGRYVLDYEERFRGIVAEETYTQRMEIHGSPLGIQPRQHRVPGRHGLRPSRGRRALGLLPRRLRSGWP